MEASSGAMTLEGLLEEASQQAGLDDFGDPSFREGLELLVSSYEQEARLSALGRGAVRGRLTQFLVNRLKLHDWLFRQPEILEEAIERPIFILGLPRTGTTLLHDLLALDPLSRAPLHWEAEEPCPPPQLFHSVTDPRIQTAHAKLRALDAMAPEMKVIHPMAAGAPTECMTLLIHEFKSLEFECQAWVPTYGAWFTHCDKASAYRTHRKLLQLLQWRSPNETWVLKAPTHLFGLDALLAEYPDAQVIFTHRDPLKVVASQASLIAVASGLLSDEVDPHRSASWWSAKTATGLEKATKLRDRMGPEAFFDLQYHELVRDPVGAVRRAYAHFGREVTPVHERRMRAWMRDNPSDEHGRHRYTLEQFGLDAEQERRRFSAYRERFGVPAES
jgi:hypothetical protein